MANNHYVSQLIIRRFYDGDNKIHVFDSKNQVILENRNSCRIFCEKDIFTDEVEQKLSQELESPFARLIDNKIINKKEITLTRKDISLIKKYMLVDSLKTFNPEMVYSIFSEFSKIVDKYWDINSKLERYFPSNLPSMVELEDTKEEFFERILLVSIESNSLQEIAFHKKACKELYLWAKAFLDGYIAFWDSNPSQEFILTDNGMTSEYEPSHLIFSGISISKFPYIVEKLSATNDKFKQAVYVTILEKLPFLYENFSIFNLTSKRSIVTINPFFRLYTENSFSFTELNGRSEIETPDIWPSFIETKSAFQPPQNNYNIKGLYTDNDEFKYIPIELSIYDTIYLNTLFLGQTHKLIGFRSIDKISDSLSSYIALRSAGNNDVYTENPIQNMINFIKHVENDEYGYIFKHFKDVKIESIYYPDKFLYKYGKMCLDDTRNNIYSLKYLLKNEEFVRNKSNFDFMGSPDKRIEMIKADLRKIEKV